MHCLTFVAAPKDVKEGEAPECQLHLRSASTEAKYDHDFSLLLLLIIIIINTICY